MGLISRNWAACATVMTICPARRRRPIKSKEAAWLSDVFPSFAGYNLTHIGARHVEYLADFFRPNTVGGILSDLNYVIFREFAAMLFTSKMARSMNKLMACV